MKQSLTFIDKPGSQNKTLKANSFSLQQKDRKNLKNLDLTFHK